jgi:hypothetical protein
MNLTSINNLDEAKQFLKYCVEFLGRGFHPDDSFTDYIDVRNGETMFSTDNAILFDRLMGECFDVCSDNDIDIYELASSFM